MLFGDAGDVSRAPRFRFDHPKTSAGFRLRYFAPGGGFAFRVPGAQVIGVDERYRGPRDDTLVSLGFVRWPGVFHLSIGESF